MNSRVNTSQEIHSNDQVSPPDFTLSPDRMREDYRSRMLALAGSALIGILTSVGSGIYAKKVADEYQKAVSPLQTARTNLAFSDFTAPFLTVMRSQEKGDALVQNEKNESELARFKNMEKELDDTNNKLAAAMNVYNESLEDSSEEPKEIYLHNLRDCSINASVAVMNATAKPSLQPHGLLEKCYTCLNTLLQVSSLSGLPSDFAEELQKDKTELPVRIEKFRSASEALANNRRLMAMNGKNSED